VCNTKGPIACAACGIVRICVRATADELQFIDRERIKEAQMREPQSLSDDPLICGVDVSGGGAAWNVAAFRHSGDP
jgi:hypothetical protein